MNKKKAGIIIGAAVAVAAAAGGGLWYFLRGNEGNSADKVYVASVSSMDPGSTGMQNRYSGVVEPQETWEVNKDEEKEVKAVLVATGDKVEEGTPLFEYDTEDMKNELAQEKLELEEMQNEITGSREQINQLNEEKNAAPEEEKLDYTTQIQSVENSIKQTEYNIESKKIEMQKKQQAIDNAVVTSKIAGVVKSINESGVDDIGNSTAYMTILATGAYRVKGTISEQNVWSIAEEQKVIIRSRIDEEKTWTGAISKIDTENQETSNGNMDMGESDTSQMATKYPFYVTVDSTDGLILGQHVYIEMDEGQTKERKGIWLNEGYVVKEEKKEAYVWAADKKKRLEKRKIELGEYDEELGEYEIVSGLSKDDYIAYPMPGLYEGVSTVKDESEVDYSSPLYKENGMEDETAPEEEMIPEDGMMPEEEMILEEEMMNDGEVMDDVEALDEPAEPEEE